MRQRLLISSLCPALIDGKNPQLDKQRINCNQNIRRPYSCCLNNRIRKQRPGNQWRASLYIDTMDNFTVLILNHYSELRRIVTKLLSVSSRPLACPAYLDAHAILAAMTTSLHCNDLELTIGLHKLKIHQVSRKFKLTQSRDCYTIAKDWKMLI